MNWRCHVPFAPPAANAFMRMHWAKRRAMKKEWRIAIIAAFGTARPTQAKDKRLVTITIRTPRARDHANLWLAADKLILDNLTVLGWIVDDSTTWLDVEVRSEKGPAEVTIDIEEI